ncbi:hypothetical protein KDL44_10015 [bacterium]|nr:hypothetical protein [bacterium]
MHSRLAVSGLICTACLSCILLNACPREEQAAVSSSAAAPVLANASPGTETEARADAIEAGLRELYIEREAVVPPGWLVDNPPLQALFPPSGEIITLGQPGALERSEWPARMEVREGEFQRWYVYDPSGRLIHEMEDGEHWWEHYFPAWREKFEGARSNGVSPSEYAGYLVFRDGEGEVIEIFDYEGTLMPEGFNPVLADFNRMQLMYGDELEALGSDDAEPQDGFRPPDWLLEDIPLRALFPPSGEVVTQGMPGAYERSREGNGPLEEDEFSRWYIYSPDGELLNPLPMGQHWWEHYFPGWNALCMELQAQNMGAADYNGYLLFHDSDTDELKRTYDYDGTLMPAGFDPYITPDNRMRVLSWQDLQNL